MTSRQNDQNRINSLRKKELGDFNEGVAVPHRAVRRYDGQMIWSDSQAPDYELGNYLGGGAAGIVYESVNLKSYEHVALKVLNPIGYKLVPSSILQRCTVVKEGDVVSSEIQKGKRKMDQRYVWWLKHPSTHETIAAYKDTNKRLRCLPLRRCVEVWGWNYDADADLSSKATEDGAISPLGIVAPMTPPAAGKRVPFSAPDSPSLSTSTAMATPATKAPAVSSNALQSDGFDRNSAHADPAGLSPGYAAHMALKNSASPKRSSQGFEAPPESFEKFVKYRRTLFKEIRNMSKLSDHKNVLQLIEVLEHVQDSKTTIFLVLELASGGELFDRIVVDRGTDEATARQYYRQLLSGIQYCHRKGVCHRDLKPENLLLTDEDEDPTLKIADFGLSALFHQQGGDRQRINGGLEASSLRRLRSVVGSPHYVAPEIIHENNDGYVGSKTDMWSSGIILYAMLAGNLPFGKELLQCPRFVKWNEWSRQRRRIQMRSSTPKDASQQKRDRVRLPYPTWFFPAHFSASARKLLTELLDPNPDTRMCVDEALRHVWLNPHNGKIASLDADDAFTSAAPNTIVGADAAFELSQTEKVEEEIDSRQSKAADNDETDEEKMQEEAKETDGDDRNDANRDGRDSLPTSRVSPNVDRSSPVVYRSLRSMRGENGNAGKGRGGLILSMLKESGDNEKNVEIVEPSWCSNDRRAENRTPASSPGSSPHRRSPSRPSFASPPLIPMESGTEPNSLSLDNVDIVDGVAKAPPKIVSKVLYAADEGDSSSKKRPARVPTGVPMFKDVVKRSTRFTTAVPASEVLHKIHDIIENDPNPMLRESAPPKVSADWNAFKLDVSRDDVCIFTVRVFQLRAGLYMVEFLRGHLDTFQFKRFYESIRRKLSEVVKNDYMMHLLDAHMPTTHRLRRSLLRRSQSC